MKPVSVSPLADLCARAVQLVRQPPRFAKFVVVGCVNAVVSYSTFGLALFLTHADNLSVVISWCVGIAFNFFSTGRLVFGNRDLSRAGPFVLSYAVCMGVNLALINALHVVGLGGLIAQAICLPVVVVVSYVINSRLVFRPDRTTRGEQGGAV